MRRFARALLCASMLTLAGTAVAAPATAGAIDEPRPKPAVAQWALETSLAIPVAAALDDRQGLAGPLTPTGLKWRADARLVDARTASFDGRTTVLTANGAGLDTAGPFGVTAWTHVDDNVCTGERTAVSADGLHTSAFRLVFDCATRVWRFEVADRDVTAPAYASVAAPVDAEHWTHLAGSFDPATARLALYVDGTLTAATTAPADWVAARGPGWDAGQIVVGRDRRADVDGGWFAGQIADVRLFDRPLLDEDLTGGFGEPGAVEPVLVGRWGFDEGRACYDPAVTACVATDQSSWDRQLKLTSGALMVEEGGPDSFALALDTTHWIEDPSDPHYGVPTQEYGRSQRNANPTGEPSWEDRAVLRTDESFTISTWVRLDDTTEPRTVLAQDSTAGGYSGFTIGYAAGRWEFTVRRAKTLAGDSSVASAPATDPTGWHHLVAVLDQTERQVRLYVDGTLADSEPLHARYRPWQANGPFLVGRGTTPAGPAGWLHGSVDRIQVFQGAYTDAWVTGLD